MRMNDKDPNFWALIFSNISPEIKSMFMACVIASLRIIYDKKETRWQRIALESLLCGSLSYGISAGLSYFSLPSGVSVFCGAAVGFLGVDFVRAKASQYVDKKIENQK